MVMESTEDFEATDELISAQRLGRISPLRASQLAWQTGFFVYGAKDKPCHRDHGVSKEGVEWQSGCAGEALNCTSVLGVRNRRLFERASRRPWQGQVKLPSKEWYCL